MNSSIFESNNNETMNKLNTIEYSDHWSTKPWFITATGSLSTVTVVAIIIVIFCKCVRNRDSNHIEIGLVEKSSTDKLVHKNDIHSQNIECACKQNVQNDDFNETTENVDEKNADGKKNELSTKRPMCQFKR